MNKLSELESVEVSRRSVLFSLAAASLPLTGRALWGQSANAMATSALDGRPPVGVRKFRSAAVEAFLEQTRMLIGDPVLATLFVNCFPNTLDTTVMPGTFEGKPDTVVITGDIAAMWLRDSSAQVWPYLPFARKDPALRRLLEGVIRRQVRCLMIDPYANAFMPDLSTPPLPWALLDKTEMKPGVGERKYELDSLCYPIRLAHGYWKKTGGTEPFDAAWREAMKLVVQTMRVQQRKDGDGPYRFQRMSEKTTESLPDAGVGSPAKPVGLIASGFRPSDDACVFPFLVPSNLFAVTSLRQLAEMVQALFSDATLAREALSLASEVEVALRRYAVASIGPGETIWAYEVDGFGSRLLMDDANVPSLLGLPYLETSPDTAMYEQTRRFVWSERNPWFFKGTAGQGIGGPHVGQGMIWPMSQIVYAMTSKSDEEIRSTLGMLKASAAVTGFMHESYSKDDSAKFTRPWFAWANTLFGELVAKLAMTKPELLR